MKDLPRLLECSSDAIEIEALRSAEYDRGSEAALAKALGAMALATALPASALAATTVSSSASSAAAAAAPALAAKGAVSATISATVPATSVIVAKGLFFGLLLGGASVAGVTVLERSSAPVSSAPAASVRAPALLASAPRPRPTTGAVRTEVAADAPVPAVGAVAARSVTIHAPAPSPSSRENVRSIEALPPSEAAFVDTTPSARETELSRELELLDRARRDLASGDPRSALSALERREREIENPALNPEATLIRVQALLASGERDRALALAKEFLSRVSSGPHAERMRRLIATSH